jgi:hypothetical protein
MLLLGRVSGIHSTCVYIFVCLRVYPRGMCVRSLRRERCRVVRARGVRARNTVTYAHVCSRMLTYADVF